MKIGIRTPWKELRTTSASYILSSTYFNKSSFAPAI